MEETASPRKKRVTVLYDGMTAPTLLHLSDFEVPTPETLFQNYRARPGGGDSRAGTSRSRSSNNFGSPPYSQQMAERMSIDIAITTEQQ